MPVEFIGIVHGQNVSEIHPPEGPPIDKAYVRAIAGAHEAGGFDRVLIAHHSSSPDGYLTASHVFEHTERLGVLLAHRPGFVAPTLTARSLATLDTFSGGRLAVHIITGGDDEEQRRDGDWLDKDARYARSGEYLDIVKRIWTSDKPIDHEGEYYRFQGAFSAIKPVQKPHLPIYFGGSSEAAIRTAGRYADVLRPVGRVPGRGEGDAEPRARGGRPARARRPYPLQPVAAPDHRRDRGGGVAEGRAHPGEGQGPAGQEPVLRQPQGAGEHRLAAPAGDRRPRARSWTSGCGPRSQRSAARAATPPPWSARPSR
ncbi:MAG: LLM class flavin-dependent oxidoreductase [Caulobacteraceae bacterium]